MKREEHVGTTFDWKEGKGSSTLSER